MFKDAEALLSVLTPVDFGNKVFTKGIAELVGKEKSDKVMSDLNLYGTIKKFPDALEKSFVITNTELKYDKPSKSFVSVGKIGLGSINKNEFYRQVPGNIQIKKQKGGDILNLYFEFDPNTWYFFSFFKGVMSVVSSNVEFNNDIKNMKAGDRKQELAKDNKGPSFQFTICSPEKRKQFLRKMQQLNDSSD